MKRVLTALVLLFIGLYVLFNGGLPLILFLTIIGILSFYEVKKMTELSSNALMATNMIFFVLIMAYIYQFNLSFSLMYAVPVATLFIVFCYEFFNRLLIFRSYPFLNNLKYFSYIYFGFSSVYFIRLMNDGLVYISLLFLSIWSTDVFAYYGGRAFGKTKLSELSPKKTVEGTVIGVLSAGFFVGIGCYLFNLSYFFLVAALLIGLLAQMGDLYESLIKRTYNVKDSSNILPGHGGILDRADSTLFVAPIFYLIILLLQ